MTLNKHKQIEFKKAEEREAKKANSPVDLSGLAGAIDEAIIKAKAYLRQSNFTEDPEAMQEESVGDATEEGLVIDRPRWLVHDEWFTLPARKRKGHLVFISMARQ